MFCLTSNRKLSLFFLKKTTSSQVRVVHFLQEQDTFRKQIMEIVKDLPKKLQQERQTLEIVNDFGWKPSGSFAFFKFCLFFQLLNFLIFFIFFFHVLIFPLFRPPFFQGTLCLVLFFSLFCFSYFSLHLFFSFCFLICCSFLIKNVSSSFFMSFKYVSLLASNIRV